MVKWPRLVPQSVCTTQIRVELEAGIDDDGAPCEGATFEGMCNYSEKSRQVLTADKTLIQLEGTALLDGDPAPGVPLHGVAYVGKEQTMRRIYRFSRARNPDGTVNFTALELM